MGSRWRWTWPPTDPESHYMLILLHEHIKWHTSQWPRPDIKDQNRIKRSWARKSPLLPWWTKAYTAPPTLLASLLLPLSLLFKIKSLSPEMDKELMWTYFPTLHFSILWPLIKLLLCWPQLFTYWKKMEKEPCPAKAETLSQVKAWAVSIRPSSVIIPGSVIFQSYS